MGLIKEIQYFQKVAYGFPAIPSLIEVLQQLGTIESGEGSVYNQVLTGDDELYEMSLVFEPREEDDDEDED